MRNALILHGTNNTPGDNWYPWLESELTRRGYEVWNPLLGQLAPDKRVKLTVSVAGFYRDDGFGCEELLTEPYDWSRIRAGSEKIVLIASDDDPYIDREQTEFLARQLAVEPTVLSAQRHFSVSTAGDKYRSFPQLIEIIDANS